MPALQPDVESAGYQRCSMSWCYFMTEIVINETICSREMSDPSNKISMIRA